MEAASVVAVLIGALGSALGGIALLRQQKGTELALAWEMTRSQLDDLQTENRELTGRVFELEVKIRRAEEELRECRQARQQLATQVEILRMRFGDDRPRG